MHFPLSASRSHPLWPGPVFLLLRRFRCRTWQRQNLIRCRIFLLVVLIHCRGSGALVPLIVMSFYFIFLLLWLTEISSSGTKPKCGACPTTLISSFWSSSVHQDLGELASCPKTFFYLGKKMDLNHLVLSENRDKSVLFCFVFSNLLQSRLQNVFGYLCVTSCPAQTGSSILALVRCCCLWVFFFLLATVREAASSSMM